MWRNRDHLTATFVEQLTPSMQQLIGRHLGGETTPGTQPLEEETPA